VINILCGTDSKYLKRKEVNQMKKTITVVLSLLFILAVTSVTFAAEKQVAPAPAAKAAPAAPAAKAVEQHVKGDITAVDANAMTVTVKGKKGDVTVTVDAKTEFKLGKDKKTVADLKVGEKVKILYHEADGKNIAKSISEAPKK
jgi:Cu/Ag efflux protein CusF